MPEILLTGASGFIGAALLRSLLQPPSPLAWPQAWPFGRVRVALRKPSALAHTQALPHAPALAVYPLPAWSAPSDWSAALAGTHTVIHAAAQAEVGPGNSAASEQALRLANIDATLALARQAAAEGVRRLVFISSLKVHGEWTAHGQRFRHDDTPHPIGPYAQSKWEAEQGLLHIAAQTGLELVILRPPLVYGPGVKGNFAALMRWVARGRVLPLGAIKHNARSLVALDNLVDLALTCAVHPAAANQTFLVSDGLDLSTAALLHRVGEALGRPARLWPLPQACLRLGAQCIGRPAVYQRLCGSLQVDMEHTQQRLGWVPPIDLDEGLRRAVQGLKR